MISSVKFRPYKAKLAKGFTLIELMIAVAIVGILAAISIPTFNDYLNRSKVSEVLAVLNACKVSVAEFIVSNNAMPVNAQQAGCDPTPNTSYAGKLAVNNTGRISVVVQNVHPDINGDQIAIRPSSTPSPYTALPAGTTDISFWQCGGNQSAADPGRRFMAANCRSNVF